jgi:opacity protein-like surface antigen
MKRVLLSMTALLMLTAAVAAAQNTTRTTSTMYSQPESRIELIGMAGYAWTMGMDVYFGNQLGELDFSDEVYYGGALDYTVSPPGSMKIAQVRLLYRREDGQLEARGITNRFTTDGSVEYLHIGGVTGVNKGKTMPFATVSLGATHFSVDDLDSGSLHVQGSDSWKFSMIFGLGVKVYTSEKIGFMIEGNWPITFTDAWGGVSVGTGGVSAGISGTGVSQLDVGGGLIIRL